MVRSAGCHGNLLWLDVDERIFAFNVGQHTRFTVDASDARYVAMQVLLGDGTTVYVSDRLRFVNVRIVEPTDVRRSIACMGPSVLDVTSDGDPSNIIAAACIVELSRVGIVSRGVLSKFFDGFEPSAHTKPGSS
jgi:hypothetical protein